ncbi:hypothetical protein, partial [Burkholderia sp. WTPI3]
QAQADSAGTARIARIEAAAARLAAAGPDTPASPAPRPKHRQPAIARAQLARANAEPESTDR